MTWSDLISFILYLCLRSGKPSAQRTACCWDRCSLPETTSSRVWELMRRLIYSLDSPIRCLQIEEQSPIGLWVGVGWLGAMVLPVRCSTFYWCPKGSGLEVSPSGKAGSNSNSWIWKPTRFRRPSGRPYWKRNKCACWEAAYQYNYCGFLRPQKLQQYLLSGPVHPPFAGRTDWNNRDESAPVLTPIFTGFSEEKIFLIEKIER